MFNPKWLYRKIFKGCMGSITQYTIINGKLYYTFDKIQWTYSLLNNPCYPGPEDQPVIIFDIEKKYG